MPNVTARLAETLALALIMGTADDPAQARADLRQANHATEVDRQAESLARYRAGEPVWAWPNVAPWSGFSSAR